MLVEYFHYSVANAYCQYLLEILESTLSLPVTLLMDFLISCITKL